MEIPGCSHKVEACVRGYSLTTVNNGGSDVSAARADEGVLTASTISLMVDGKALFSEAPIALC